MGMRYRIVEHWEEFHIQVWGIKRSIECSKSLFGKNKIVEKEDWCSCNYWGQPVLRLFSLHGFTDPPLPPFKTLEEAKDKIRIWQTPDVIYEV